MSILWLCSLFFIILLNSHAIFAKLLWIEPRLPLQGERPDKGTPWPLPREWKKSNKVYFIDSRHFTFTSNAALCDVIDNAINFYTSLLNNNNNNNKYISFKARSIDNKKNEYYPQYMQQQKLSQEKEENDHQILSININVFNLTCDYPQLYDDESYVLMINNSNNIIQSSTIWGALRGLETFSQLLYNKDDNTNNNVYYINETYIYDYPEYTYRSIMLDTARHYIPKDILFANLDAMAYNKFNVFHWHITDDQSFPLELNYYPDLAKYGSYKSNYIYTQEDIKEIIEYARLCGIRVIPEIDTPGHTYSFGRKYPQLLTSCYYNNTKNTAHYPHHSASEVLNPISNFTYDFIKNIFIELKSLFTDDYIHLGMDEVWYSCWSSNPEIREFMINHGMVQMNELEQYYVARTIANVQNIGYKYLLWQDPVDNGVKIAKDSIVQIWKDSHLDAAMKSWQEYTKPIAEQGYQMVLSACWYLNYINYPYPGNDWEKYYECDLRSFSDIKHEQDLVIGGEACLWSEFVDATNLISRLWPRASSIAERLWSDIKDADINNVRFRLDQQRCRMLKRGIDAAPILNGYCEDFDWMNRPKRLRRNQN